MEKDNSTFHIGDVVVTADNGLYVYTDTTTGLTAIDNNVSTVADNYLNASNTITWTAPTTTNSTITVNTDNTSYWRDTNIITATPSYNWGTTTIIGDGIQEEIKKVLKDLEKENDKMTNYSFGSYSSNSVRLSPFGLAIKNKAGKWVSYNRETRRLIDVDVFNIDIDTSKIFFTIPKAIDDVVPGDIIIHNGNPVFVDEVNNGRFKVVNPYEGSEMTILATQSPFGFDFVNALVSLTDYMPEADENNPFGALLPFVLGSKGDNSALLMMMMTNGSLENIDPMMFALMSGNTNPMVLMMMMGKNKKNKKKEFIGKFNAIRNRNGREDIDE